ncbi:MAG TPA: RDD family protein [Gemmataceae bacterium]|jgi:uncharacterized RDD family membrane protein YckC|nr:RDD family protein [Gemmataceae bacterium]
MLLHDVMTTEKVPFSYRVAGLGSRFLAWLIDLGVIIFLAFVGLVVAMAAAAGRQGLGTAILAVWTFVLQWGYFVLFEWLWHGQTPGKRLLGIRVIQWQGTGVSFFQAAVRNVLRVADGLPLLVVDVVPPLLYGVGFLTAACNREHRRLGDLAAGTLVVHVQAKPRLVRAMHDSTADTDRVRDALVRQRLEQLERPQKQTLLDLCLRRDQLQVGDRARLFGAVAEYLKDRLGLVPAAYQSDEKFILQLAAVFGSDARTQEPAAVVPVGDPPWRPSGGA